VDAVVEKVVGDELVLVGVVCEAVVGVAELAGD